MNPIPPCCEIVDAPFATNLAESLVAYISQIYPTTGKFSQQWKIAMENLLDHSVQAFYCISSHLFLEYENKNSAKGFGRSPTESAVWILFKNPLHTKVACVNRNDRRYGGGGAYIARS